MDDVCDYVSCTSSPDTSREVHRGEIKLPVKVCNTHAQMLDKNHPMALYFYGVIQAG